MPTYPDGFPPEVLQELSLPHRQRNPCSNRPYSGTQVIQDYGRQHLETGDLIVYTSADSVLQIAAHEEKVPLEELYRDCIIAREIMQGDHAVGRIIARPFVGEGPFVRTANRRDFSLVPKQDTPLDRSKRRDWTPSGWARFRIFFAGKGISQKVLTHSNEEGMQENQSAVQHQFCRTLLCQSGRI